MRRAKPALLALFEVLLTAAILALFVRTFLFQAFSIPSGSMERNLLVGDRILVNKFIYQQAAHQETSSLEDVLSLDPPRWLASLLPTRPVRRADVVVFRYPLQPSRDFIKRCLGLSEDTIEIDRRHLHINGEEVDESAYTYYTDDIVYPRSVVLPEELRSRDNYGPYTVPEGHYFCLGDNRNNSHDSRSWGPVPASHLIGRGWLVYWSTAQPLPDREPLGDASTGARPIPQAPLQPHPRTGSGPSWQRMFRLVR